MARESAFEYYPDSGLIWKEIVEPNDTSAADKNPIKTITTYTYDAFGNKDSVTVAGGGIGNRKVSFGYDANGRFLISKKIHLDPSDATKVLAHTFTTSPALGVVLSATDANGLTTMWKTDGFGRIIQEDRPEMDGTTYQAKQDAQAKQRTLFTYRWCSSAPPGYAKYSIETQTAGRPPTITFYDAMGRAMYSFAVNGGVLAGPNAGARIVGTRTWYDNKGLISKVSLPFYYSGSVNESALTAATSTTFDNLDRPILVITADDENGAGNSSIAYNGLETTATNRNLQKTVTKKNELGWVTSVSRNDGGAPEENGVVAYVYDPIGNICKTKVRKADGSYIVSSLVYDRAGRKIAMDDVSMGHWEYRYNAAGEIVWQKDAKSQEVNLTYDDIGRIKSRTESEGQTVWTYDTAANGKGKVHKVTSPTDRGRDGEIIYAYNPSGRNSNVTRRVGSEQFVTGQEYDEYGRPSVTVYPTGYKTRNKYNTFGFLREVRDDRPSKTSIPTDTPAGMVYWQADSYSLWGGPDGAQLGNGVVVDRITSSTTGRVRGVVAGDLATPYIQNVGYNYDVIGNVVTRTDQPYNSAGAILTRSESFEYDGLSRLKKHTMNGAVSTVTYDALGNIKSKTGAGTSFVYDPVRAYSVTAVAGGPLGAKSYRYDANGNMDVRDGYSIEWTSYNQARKVNSASGSSEFWFDADRQRTVQVAATGVTTYYGGALYEKLVTGSRIEHKFYIVTPHGRSAVRIEANDATVKTRWFHQDALGSITAVSDEIGRVEARFAYDPWGKRGPTSGTYTRGFTDHEQLELQGLVHMNGRIYDPVLGRFLSADPNVDGGGDSQGFNRYSYVGNNPLGATDPTGFFKLKDALKIVAVVAVAIVSAGAGLWAIGAANSLWAGMGMVATASFGGGWAGLANAVAAGAAGGFGSGFAGSLLNGGSIGDAFKSGLVSAAIGGVSAGLAFGIGEFAQSHAWFSKSGLKHFAHGLAQGGVTEAAGGEFRHGFYAAAMSSAAAGRISALLPGNSPGRVAAAALVGGTASVVGGGKFANGAVTGAVTYLFNQAAHERFAVVLTGDGLPNERSFWQDEAKRLAPYGNVVADGFESIEELDAVLGKYKKHADQYLLIAGHGGAEFNPNDGSTEYGFQIGGKFYSEDFVQNLALKHGYKNVNLDHCSIFNASKSNAAINANQIRSMWGVPRELRWTRSYNENGDVQWILPQK